MSDEVPEVLYDRKGGAMYLSRNKVVTMIAEIDKFRAYRDNFDKERVKAGFDRNKAGHMAERTERIRRMVPNEVRESLPDYFRISDKDLDELHKKYSEVFFGVKTHAA